MTQLSLDCWVCDLANEEEALYVADAKDIDSALTKLLELCPAVIIKRGPSGATAQIRGGNRIDIDAVKTAVVDTTGAGDIFAGGFIAAKISGSDLRASVVRENKLLSTHTPEMILTFQMKHRYQQSCREIHLV